MPLKILHLFGGLVEAGAELRTVNLVSRLDPARYSFDFCAVKGRPGPLDERLRARGAEVLLLGRDRGFAPRLLSWLRRHRYGVLHAHLHHASGLYLALGRLAGVPGRIAHYRSTFAYGPDDFRRRLTQRLLKCLTAACATDVLAVSQAAMQAAWSPAWQRQSRCRVVYNGIEPAACRRAGGREKLCRTFGWSQDSLVAVHLGRFGRAKNHPRLLDIFGALLARLPQARLLLVGDPDADPRTRAEVERKLRRNRWRDRVAVAGARPHKEALALLGAADLMLFPSLWEGMPGAVLEACAAGVPVLASDLPALREIRTWLPFVRLLPLDAPDPVWADETIKLYAEREALPARERIDALFRRSPFDMDRATAALCTVWDRYARS